CTFKNLFTFATAKQLPRNVQPLNRGNYVGSKFTYRPLTATVRILTRHGPLLPTTIKILKF
ncbi:MAG: hypothetical protein ACOVMQ_01665, partial [Cyclobacteriaceae bacterium]